jgi:site-specific recombinase XerC
VGVSVSKDIAGNITVAFKYDHKVVTAARSSGIDKLVSVHTFRHCFATHLLEANYDRGVPRKVRHWRTQGAHINLGSYLSGKPRLVGVHIRTVQELLGHNDVSTTMIYTHVLNKPGLSVKSPLDT